MKRRFCSAAVFVLALCLGSSAFAIGKFGVRIGTGVSHYDDAGDPEPEFTPFAIGAGWLLDLTVIELEVDALYWSSTDSSGSSDVSEARLALPVLAKIGIPMVPLLDVGAGLEPRFMLSGDPKAVEDDAESMVIYLPLVLAVTIDLSAFAVGIEARYERQITASSKANDKFRNHQFMLMGGFFF